MLIPYKQWHSYRSAEDFDETLTVECSIHPSAFAGHNPNQFLQAQNGSQIRSVNLRFTFESQIHLGFVFEKPISDQSEIRFGFADCPRQTFASAG